MADDQTHQKYVSSWSTINQTRLSLIPMILLAMVVVSGKTGDVPPPTTYKLLDIWAPIESSNIQFPPIIKSTTSTSSTPLTTTSIPTSTSIPTTTSNSTEKPQLFDYGRYLKGVAGPLGVDDLEYGLDYYSEREKALLQEFDFDPAKTVRSLIDCAAAQNTTPEQFLGDMQDLIYLQNRSKAESKEVGSQEPSYRLASEPSFRESWKTELRRLEKKYRVSSDCSDPEAPATVTRLAVMFPHYLNMGQKPFAVRADVCVSYRCAPSFFQHPSFGGLIPQAGGLNETARLAVFTIHLRFLEESPGERRDSAADALPFRTKCALVQRRMEKSLVSDERRCRFLQNNDVITADGELTSTIENIYEQISSNFKASIFLSRRRKSSSRAYDMLRDIGVLV